jgi:putative ABC transport system substrate-binding protein
VRRRDFITLLDGAAAGWPLAARGQQPAVPLVGFLNGRALADDPELIAAFRQGLNVAIDYRFEDQYDRLSSLAAELVRRQVTVIVANGPAAKATKEATPTIPIVFVAGYDPVESGLVTRLSRPGGNITGLSILDMGLGPKRLEMLHELLPAANIVAALVNPSDPGRAEITSREFQESARTLGLQLRILHASSDREVDAASAGVARPKAGGLVIGGADLPVQRLTKVELILNLKTVGAQHGVSYARPETYRPWDSLRDPGHVDRCCDLRNCRPAEPKEYELPDGDHSFLFSGRSSSDRAVAPANPDR